jgi:mannonate dehydratase
MRRRDFLGAILAPVFLAGCDFDLGDGLFNECRDPRSGNFVASPLVARAWQGLRSDQVWDVHVHLFGNGRGNRGVWIDPGFDHGWGPANRARRAFFMNAACAGSDEERLDGSMVRRLADLADQFPSGAKAMLLAFDFTYDERGQRRPDLTTFSISNDYAQSVAQARPDRFEWNASVHPYREDAVAALEAAKAGGARAVKWLPPTMNIDLANPRCKPVYEALARLDLPILVHVGEEKAVPGAERGDLANPLLLRHPLDAGVRVIAAHCASLGMGADLDAGEAKGRDVPNIDLFARLMADRNYEGRLVGDISAITQANRHGVVRRILLQRDWDGRLLNGSDYPLPGVKPLFSLDGLVKQGVLDKACVPILAGLRETNALLFDFVLKRCLAVDGRRFPDVTFETRGFFERKA